MITNGSLTIYHKQLNPQTRLEQWIRSNYDNVWIFKQQNAVLNKGYDNQNNIEIRISYQLNQGLDPSNFSIGDIILPIKSLNDIEKEADLKEQLTYHITSIKNNNFGINQHIHLSGK